jgi:hypothetical protein
VLWHQGIRRGGEGHNLCAKNSFHVVGHDARGAIVLRQKW